MGRKRKWQKPPPPRPATPPADEGGEPAQLSNRLARKEEARLQREAIRRRAIRRRRLRLGGIVVGSLAAVAVAVILVILLGNQSKQHQRQAQDEARARHAALIRQEDALVKQAPSAEKAAGCTAVQTTANYNHNANQDHLHVPQIPPLTTYPTIPPASGPHAPIPPGPLPSGVYSTPPDIARVLHSMEHGAAIVWYSPPVSGQPLSELTAFFGDFVKDPTAKLLVAPYSYDQAGGTLPAPHQMALVAWHRVEYCNEVSLPAAYAFVRSFMVDPAHPKRYKGVAREPLVPL